MNDSERDKLLGRLDERTEQTLIVVSGIKGDVDVLFGQTRALESRISGIEGGRSMMFKLFGSGGLLAGLGYGASEIIKKIMGNG